jgi:chemotaxis protein CheD
VRVSEEGRATPAAVAPARPVLRRTYLPPGDLVVSREPMTISTVLGSCVSVCLWDSALRIGGMNHFLLPRGSADSPLPLRYGNVATHTLVDRMLALGCHCGTLRAKVFGGASVIESLAGNPLAAQNALTAQAVLLEREIAVVATDLGGQRARRLAFETDDGTVWVRMV